MSGIGVPDTVVREAAHADLEATVVAHDHDRNEELFANLEQEEGPIAVRAEPFAVFLHELDDLRLGETKTVEVIAHAVEDLGEGTVLNHLADGDLGFLCRGTADIRAVVLEVGIDPPGEGLLRFRDGSLAIRLVELECLSTGDDLDDAGDVLGYLGKLLLNQGGDGGDDLIATRPHTLDVLSVENTVLGELAESGAGSLASGIGDQGHAGFDLAVTDFFY